MANLLTWQNVANPNLPNVSNEITEAAKLVTSGLVGLGNVGSDFFDRNVNEQLAKYNDAAQMQADVANGVVDLSNASNRLITSLPNKYETLQGITENQQKLDFTNATQTGKIASTNVANNQSILETERANTKFQENLDLEQATRDLNNILTNKPLTTNQEVLDMNRWLASNGTKAQQDAFRNRPEFANVLSQANPSIVPANITNAPEALAQQDGLSPQWNSAIADKSDSTFSMMRKAQNIAESGDRHLDPKTGNVITSSAGAVGPSQILPGTGVQYAREMGDKRPASEIIKQLKDDPDFNRSIGDAYMRKMLNNYDGDYIKAFIAYNAGPGTNNPNSPAYNKGLAAYERNFAKWHQENPGKSRTLLSFAPKQTQDYVANIQKFYEKNNQVDPSKMVSTEDAQRSLASAKSSISQTIQNLGGGDEAIFIQGANYKGKDLNTITKELADSLKRQEHWRLFEMKQTDVDQALKYTDLPGWSSIPLWDRAAILINAGPARDKSSRFAGTSFDDVQVRNLTNAYLSPQRNATAGERSKLATVYSQVTKAEENYSKTQEAYLKAQEKFNFSGSTADKQNLIRYEAAMQQANRVLMKASNEAEQYANQINLIKTAKPPTDVGDSVNTPYNGVLPKNDYRSVTRGVVDLNKFLPLQNQTKLTQDDIRNLDRWTK